MNKGFFKTFWAALLAFVVGGILLIVLSVMLFAGIGSAFSTTTPVVVAENSVLKIDFAENIVDGPASTPTPTIDPMSMSLSFSSTLSMRKVEEALEAAAIDPKIKAIYISYEGPGDVSGTAMMEELRAALVKFRNSGKPIFAYNKTYTSALYWLTSVADHIYINPEGVIEWHGVASNVVFYKGLIDKLGINMEILRHGTFKSAVEPFMDTKMSPANRMQTQTMVNTIWDAMLTDISASRNIDKALLQEYADNLALALPQDGVERGFFDAAIHEDEVMKIIAETIADEGVEVDEDAKPEMVSLGDYSSQVTPNYKRMPRNKVAVIYAAGEIVDGSSAQGSLGDQTLVEQLARAREDSGVKAVVLRVNSPGGSALASEIMWREIERLRAEKPVIVSMGDYAASGGYYISAPADVILANRTTLTGSIGVFGLLFNAGEALEDKIGVTFDVVSSADHADLGALYRPMKATERAYMMKQIERTYSTFIGHVADGRNMTIEEVDAIGQGRVWCGSDAAQIGLVDGMGTLSDAIALAADRAGVADDYRVVEIAPEEDALMAMLSSLMAKVKAPTKTPTTELQEVFTEYNHLLQMLSTEGVQARMPYTITIE